MMQFLIRSLQASAISCSCFSTRVNPSALPTVVAQVNLLLWYVDPSLLWVMYLCLKGSYIPVYFYSFTSQIIHLLILLRYLQLRKQQLLFYHNS